MYRCFTDRKFPTMNQLSLLKSKYYPIKRKKKKKQKTLQILCVRDKKFDHFNQIRDGECQTHIFPGNKKANRQNHK